MPQNLNHGPHAGDGAAMVLGLAIWTSLSYWSSLFSNQTQTPTPSLVDTPSPVFNQSFSTVTQVVTHTVYSPLVQTFLAVSQPSETPEPGIHIALQPVIEVFPSFESFLNGLLAFLSDPIGQLVLHYVLVPLFRKFISCAWKFFVGLGRHEAAPTTMIKPKLNHKLRKALSDLRKGRTKRMRRLLRTNRALRFQLGRSRSLQALANQLESEIKSAQSQLNNRHKAFNDDHDRISMETLSKVLSYDFNIDKRLQELENGKTRAKRTCDKAKREISDSFAAAWRKYNDNLPFLKKGISTTVRNKEKLLKHQEELENLLGTQSYLNGQAVHSMSVIADVQHELSVAKELVERIRNSATPFTELMELRNDMRALHTTAEVAYGELRSKHLERQHSMRWRNMEHFNDSRTIASSETKLSTEAKVGTPATCAPEETKPAAAEASLTAEQVDAGSTAVDPSENSVTDRSDLPLSDNSSDSSSNDSPDGMDGAVTIDAQQQEIPPIPEIDLDDFNDTAYDATPPLPPQSPVSPDLFESHVETNLPPSFPVTSEQRLAAIEPVHAMEQDAPVSTTHEADNNCPEISIFTGTTTVHPTSEDPILANAPVPETSSDQYAAYVSATADEQPPVTARIMSTNDTSPADEQLSTAPIVETTSSFVPAEEVVDFQFAQNDVAIEDSVAAPVPAESTITSADVEFFSDPSIVDTALSPTSMDPASAFPPVGPSPSSLQEDQGEDIESDEIMETVTTEFPVAYISQNEHTVEEAEMVMDTEEEVPGSGSPESAMYTEEVSDMNMQDAVDQFEPLAPNVDLPVSEDIEMSAEVDEVMDEAPTLVGPNLLSMSPAPIAVAPTGPSVPHESISDVSDEDMDDAASSAISKLAIASSEPDNFRPQNTVTAQEPAAYGVFSSTMAFLNQRSPRANPNPFGRALTRPEPGPASGLANQAMSANHWLEQSSQTPAFRQFGSSATAQQNPTQGLSPGFEGPRAPQSPAFNPFGTAPSSSLYGPGRPMPSQSPAFFPLTQPTNLQNVGQPGPAPLSRPVLDYSIAIGRNVATPISRQAPAIPVAPSVIQPPTRPPGSRDYSRYAPLARFGPTSVELGPAAQDLVPLAPPTNAQRNAPVSSSIQTPGSSVRSRRSSVASEISDTVPDGAPADWPHSQLFAPGIIANDARPEHDQGTEKGKAKPKVVETDTDFGDCDLLLNGDADFQRGARNEELRINRERAEAEEARKKAQEEDEKKAKAEKEKKAQAESERRYQESRAWRAKLRAEREAEERQQAAANQMMSELLEDSQPAPSRRPAVTTAPSADNENGNDNDDDESSMFGGSIKATSNVDPTFMNTYADEAVGSAPPSPPLFGPGPSLAASELPAFVIEESDSDSNSDASAERELEEFLSGQPDDSDFDADSASTEMGIAEMDAAKESEESAETDIPQVPEARINAFGKRQRQEVPEKGAESLSSGEHIKKAKLD